MRETWSSTARAVMSLVLVTMLVLGLRAVAVAASGPDDDCLPAVHASHDVQPAYEAAVRASKIVLQADHTKPSRAASCCRACSQAAIAPASTNFGFATPIRAVIAVTTNPEREQAGSRGLRRPPRALLTV